MRRMKTVRCNISLNFYVIWSVVEYCLIGKYHIYFEDLCFHSLAVRTDNIFKTNDKHRESNLTECRI